MRKILLLVCLTVILANTKTAAALTISPTKIEIAGDPGQSIVGEIELYNEQSEVKTFYTSFENFEPRGETGAPYFVGGGEGLAAWLGAQGSIVINPGERVAVPYTITVPKDAVPGGYFAAVFFGNNQEESSTGRAEVSVGGKVGTLVLLRVNGEVAEGGGVLGFGIGTAKRLFTQTPLNFEYRFNNTGGDRVIPRGEILLANTLGMTVATLNANINEGSVLPNSIRKIEVPYGDVIVATDSSPETGFIATVKHQFSDFHFGLYTAKLNLTWGETQQAGASTFTFFVFPWQLTLVVSLVLLVLYFLLRQYNRFIISRSNRS